LVLKSGRDERQIAKKVIAFVCHPIEDDIKQLENVGAQFKVFLFWKIIFFK
jgi:hypothetical protein